MTRLMTAAAAALLLSTGLAAAQSTYKNTTTTVSPTMPTPMPPVVQVPTPGSLAVERSSKTVNPDGTVSSSKSTMYRKGTGAASESSTTTVHPAMPTGSTTRRTTTTTIP